MTTTRDRNKIAFRKMKKKGIPTPSIKVYDLASRSVARYYDKVLLQVEKLILKYAEDYGFKVDGKTVSKVTDSVFDLVGQVKKLLYGSEVYQKLNKQFRHQMNENQRNFFDTFYKNADPKMAKFLVMASIDKNDVFENRIKDIKENYLDNAIKRIDGEKDDLKKSFLEKLTDWAEGRSESLDISEELKEMKKTAVSRSRFFARDQFGKLNKAMLVASFKEAGVTKVKLRAVKDGATRSSHRAWDGDVYEINKIPKDWWEAYNCRCGASPVWS